MTVKRIMIYIVGATLVVAVALLVAACSGKQEAADTAASTNIPSSTAASSGVTVSGQGVTSSGTAPASGAASPKYGGTLRMVGPAVTPVIGWPPAMGNSGAGVMSQLCLETLLHEDNKGNFIPWLAESYEVADDLTSVTFHIRKGVTFHDGSELTAEVVKWNLEQFVAASAAPAGMPADAPAGAAPPAGATGSAPGATPPGGAPSASGSAGGPSTWSSVEVVDPYTVKVDLSSWSNTTIESFADAATLISMVSKTAFDQHGLDWMKSHPVGTGAFKFESFVLDGGAKFVKNPDYWRTDEAGGKLPYLDAVELIFSDEKASRQWSFLAGDADWIASVEPGKDSADFAKKGYQIFAPSDVCELLIPDTGTPGSAWAKKEVREAAEYAIDRAALAASLGAGQVEPVNQIPPIVTTAYSSDFALARTYDVAKAKELLAAAGYADGFSASLILSPIGVSRDLAVAIQGYLAVVGIKLQIETPALAAYMQYSSPGSFPAGSVLLCGMPAVDVSYLAGLNFLFGLVGSNWQRPAQLTAALQAANSATSSKPSDVRAVTDLMSSEALVMPVMAAGSGAALQPYVRNTGLGDRGTINCYDVEQTWLDK